ncbi:ABC transporter family protein [Tritrichomonas foetus]|uniref:ABC transporter family protein n=1 Tax=Tritrichomonas foetus TaxID=1144522 RepID=A0A1J4JN19_9EUKA|nr:ABC transporter family protein [Tritrichomonas foetus]|eukprot:OHT00521.1 ABC transporter family protein [Tritrichomonas foetus]
MFDNLIKASEFETTVVRRTGKFNSVVRALFKKSILIKIRHPATIIEFLLACIIWLTILPGYKFARKEYSGSLHPQVKYTSLIPTKLFIFFAITKNSSLVLVPDCNNTRNLYNLWNDTIYNFLPENITSNLSIQASFVDTVDEMRKLIYAHTSNSYGIHWVNAKDDNALTSPIIQTFVQSIGIRADDDFFELIYRSIALQNGIPEASLAITNSSYQKFATPPTEKLYDLEIMIAIIVILPIIISNMPDLTTLLEEKDSRVQTLSFLMGCSETAYFMVAFIMQFILSVIPYLFMCLSLCYWFAMQGTSFTLLFLISILFIISHIMFLMLVTTFMKKASAGRLITVIFLVLGMFFAYLHYFFTLDDSNHSEAVKHVFSIIPLSSYQMIIMTMYTQCRTSLPAVTWHDMSNPHLKYQVWYALLWLTFDSFIYFFLFVFFNLVNPRDFGSPLISWKELFNLDAWKRMFGSKRSHSNNTSLLNSLNTYTTTTSSIIQVDNLSKTYHGHKEVIALKNVSFNINQNEVIVVIGPNGAGKSTLMNILAGAIEPTKGSLRLFGEPPTQRFKEIQEILGVCFQDNVLINLLSIEEHFKLFGSFRGIPEDELKDSMNFFAETLQLKEMLKNRAGDLSGGQKRKLCIALSLLGDPPIVIMDEPTAGVDVQSRQLIWKTIASLKHTTTIVTSHALEEAEAVSSRLFVVSCGKIPFAGTATELRSQFKCGYILRVDKFNSQSSDNLTKVTANESGIENILELARQYEPQAHMSSDRSDTIEMPVSRNIPKFLTTLEKQKEQLGVKSFSFAVEQLEDVLLKLIQNEEAAYSENH